MLYHDSCFSSALHKWWNNLTNFYMQKYVYMHQRLLFKIHFISTKSLFFTLSINAFKFCWEFFSAHLLYITVCSSLQSVSSIVINAGRQRALPSYTSSSDIKDNGLCRTYKAWASSFSVTFYISLNFHNLVTFIAA